jgi:hypothetical protein
MAKYLIINEDREVFKAEVLQDIDMSNAVDGVIVVIDLEKMKEFNPNTDSWVDIEAFE